MLSGVYPRQHFFSLFRIRGGPSVLCSQGFLNTVGWGVVGGEEQGEVSKA